MKNKVLIPATILGSLAAFASFNYINNAAAQQANTQNAIIQQTVMAIIEAGHYSPQTIDDSFSNKVFNKTIEGFDYDKKIFLKEDYDALAKYRYEIDDQIKSGSTLFFDKLNQIFVMRIGQVENYYKDILKNPIAFTADEKIQLDGKKLSYPKDTIELKQRWEQLTKYRVLARFSDLKKDEEKKAKDSTNYKMLSDVELDTKARESVRKLQERYFKRLKKLNDNDRFSMYVNSLTSAEDPHTSFFPPEDRKRFDEQMSGNFIGIGAQLQQTEEGQIKVQMIITGSPSWRQGKLKVEDIIERIQPKGDEIVDIEGMEIDDVVKLIRGQKDTEVKLHVKHKDGTKEVIGIIRGTVELEDTYAKSAVIEDAGRKIGYIYLPEFYTNFTGDPNGHSSGADVEKEVIKLKKEGVDGIILDLRYNGGGSLGDVVDMAGTFVGRGPVVQVRSRGDQVMQLKSKQTEPVYTGPLAIMVNSGSASASEILAAAMQDYKRAVIVGSKTYGKGTVQKLVQLDPFVSAQAKKSIIEAWMAAKNNEAIFEGIGSLKLTIQKFYRINGGSTQKEGVTPDILLPDVYEYLDDVGERKDPASLPFDKIDAVAYTTTSSIPNMQALVAASKQRVQSNETFKLVLQTAKKLKEQQDNNVIPLNMAKYAQYRKENESLSKKLDQIDSAKTKLVILNPKSDVARVTVDSVAKEKNEKWLKTLKKDAYLAETTSIMNALIQQTKPVNSKNKK